MPLASVDTRTKAPVPPIPSVTVCKAGTSPSSDMKVIVHDISPSADGPVRDTRSFPVLSRLLNLEARSFALAKTESSPVLADPWKV